MMASLSSPTFVADWPGLACSRKRTNAPPTLAVFTATFPSSSKTKPPAASPSPTASSFVIPNNISSLAARRQHKRTMALGTISVPKLGPPTLDLNRVPTLEEEIATLPDLLSRLSLKRKAASSALSSMNMTLAGRKKARYLIVVDEEDEEPSPKASPLTPQFHKHFEIPTAPRLRHGPKKRVRFADEVVVERVESKE